MVYVTLYSTSERWMIYTHAHSLPNIDIQLSINRFIGWKVHWNKLLFLVKHRLQNQIDSSRAHARVSFPLHVGYYSKRIQFLCQKLSNRPNKQWRMEPRLAIRAHATHFVSPALRAQLTIQSMQRQHFKIWNRFFCSVFLNLKWKYATLQS